mmetsp:Transcript_16216/g.15558  ORF Transcript_16216/g.15558 Transcript_16216/m.15558 type:complete len:257 (-) Transcript_16216:273-1043(-)|eukprot:CAMPEP_0119038452 /NCGR_PEP_ID=MMETSP1177-20130426/7414_1 /TAXON_ID=2985 /ORGANISM="Ochromonas sp, Strain CCMP1899" /LENGTH=256 /DNA_ID=CAMNT_0007001089 /DNA_START=56 /DNA_END=826 /DNA_ORIENTATION=+
MKLLVGVKRVVDYAVKIRVLADKTGVDLNNVKMSLNPFCEIAIEEAVRLKEKKIANEIIAISIGPKACTETLRTALAMGADRGIHITTDLRADQEIQPLAVAKVFQFIAEREKVGAIILGKQAIDGDHCQTGPMCGALLGWPQCTFAASVTADPDNPGNWIIERETDTGTETLKVGLPMVLTADLRLNEPRYATLPNIMKAKKKPIEVLTALETGVDFAPRNKVIMVEEPPVRKAGIFVDNSDGLLDKLKNEASII